MFDRNDYQRQYRKEKLKKIQFEVPKEYYEKLKAHADRKQKTVNGYIRLAIEEAMKRDNAND